MKPKIRPTFLPAVLLILWACGPQKEPTEEKPFEGEIKPLAPFVGRIVFQSNMEGNNAIYLMTRKEIRKLTNNSWENKYPVWSPDGKRIAFTANPNGAYDIFVMNADGSGLTQITSSEHDETEPAWFPDGKHIAFSRETKRFMRRDIGLFKVSIETRHAEKLIPQFTRTHGISHVSRRDPLIAFTAKRTMGWDVAVYDMRKKEVTFIHEGGDSCRARFSKDGGKLAYVSSAADGKGDVWLMNSDGSGKKRLTLRDETYDYFPSWSPDGNHIVFNSSTQHSHDGDWALYIIEVETLRTQLLFDSPGNDVFPDWTGGR